jgi:hypothetical protein
MGGETTCTTCNHRLDHHRPLLVLGRIHAESEVEWERLETLIEAAHKKNWSGYKVFQGKLRDSAGWVARTPKKF